VTATVELAKGANRFLNRELSQIEYNARVLQQAADAELPLLERVKFCAIFSSNMDEFFAVRVAGLLDQVDAGVAVRSQDGRTPQAILSEVMARVQQLCAKQSKLWAKELCPALDRHGITVGRIDDATKDELAELASRFEREIYPVLTPLGVGPGQPFPYISALSLSLAVFVRDPDTGESRLARVKVPEGLPRFIAIGSRGLFVLTEDVIAYFLPQLFPQMEIVERAVFRVTRDADLELSDEADDLLEAVELELRRRRFGEVVRLEVSAGVSDELLERLKRGLRVSEVQVALIGGLLDLADAMELVRLDRPELKDESWQPVTPPRFAIATGSELFDEIGRGDILAHHPYESFAASFEEFVQVAAADPAVIGLKATVYRTSDESPLVPALIRAAEDGKQSVCLVELKARFDERRNIEWSRALERAGVHVVYGFPNMKVHAKAALVVRREQGELRRYVNLGTGNYHSLNARGYEDFGLYTADPEIAADVADLFNFVTGFGKPQRFRKLLVAPFNLRARLIEEVQRVSAAVAAGKSGRVRIKVNHLTDGAIIDALYEASRVGVPVDLFVRTNCALRPGVEGLSETITVKSVLGRFLEHSRVFHFNCAGEDRWFLGSADLMPRNLDHRLEVVAPVGDARLQARLAQVFDALLQDNTSWRLRADGTWAKLTPKKGDRTVSAQATLMRVARRRRPPVRRLTVEHGD
jgi:polyphosphate kinase